MKEILPRGGDGVIKPRLKLPGLPPFSGAKKIEERAEFLETEAVRHGDWISMLGAQIAAKIAQTVVELVSHDHSPTKPSNN